MALSPIELKPKQSGGKGGLWGKIAGGALALGGAIAAPFTAGTSAAAIPAGMAIAGAAAPFIGNAIDPAKQTSGRGVSTLESAAKNDPQVAMRQMIDISEEVRKSPELDQGQKNDLFAIYTPTIEELRRRR